MEYWKIIREWNFKKKIKFFTLKDEELEKAEHLALWSDTLGVTMHGVIMRTVFILHGASEVIEVFGKRIFVQGCHSAGIFTSGVQ